MNPQEMIKMVNDKKGNANMPQYYLPDEETEHLGEPKHSEENHHGDTVMDKMMKDEQHDVHLYGNHKTKHKKDGPLNNVKL